MIRPATAADIPHIMTLERSSSTAGHWTEQQYQQLLGSCSDGPQRLVLVAEISYIVLGFLIAQHVAPEWELENIVVAEAGRRKGLGKRLLDAVLTRARETNSDAVFLEVRESNASARALYENAGFEESGRRKSYYSAPQEDAILYRRSLRRAFS
jgi:[ribosomal protein S18]-alanine N-acetyltransferase